MTDYSLSIAIANEDEWVKHVKSVIEHGNGKTEEGLLEEALTFDFEFKINELQSQRS